LYLIRAGPLEANLFHLPLAPSHYQTLLLLLLLLEEGAQHVPLLLGATCRSVVRSLVLARSPAARKSNWREGSPKEIAT